MSGDIICHSTPSRILWSSKRDKYTMFLLFNSKILYHRTQAKDMKVNYKQRNNVFIAYSLFINTVLGTLYSLPYLSVITMLWCKLV